MKKIIALLAVALVASMAWAEDLEKKVSLQELPEKAQEFLNTYFEGVKVKKVIKTTDAYTFVEEFDVYLSNKTQIEFDMVGAWNEITLKNKKVEMPRFIYPNRVVDTIDNQYADKKIVKVSNDGMEYEIKFKDGSEVTINALGKILEFEK
ncbi:MAG: PepSY-like domain-containing protein [Paludibacteraceae bacterium]|nr:PepSY-like domain-containing protein [Paludibacteraceae bacterium]